MGTGQQLNYEAVRSELTLQFPEYKPSPPVFGRENLNHNNPKGQNRGKPWTHRTPAAPGGKNNGYRKGNSKGDGSYPRRVLAVSAEEEEQKEPQDEEFEDAVDGLETIPEDTNEGNHEDDGDQEDQDEYGEDEDQEGDELGQLAEVLTVTAKKLAKVTQGRVFSNGKTQSVQQRKATSSCAACGKTGHWAGGSECEISAGAPGKGGKARSSKDSGAGKDRSDKGNRKACVTRHSTAYDKTVECSDENGCKKKSHFVMMLRHVHVSEHDCLIATTEAAGYMVIDTACQRSCCGEAWCDSP